MTKKVLFTATKFDASRVEAVKRLITAVRKKFGDELVIVTGYTGPSVGIAYIANRLGVNTQIITPDLEHVNEKHLKVTKHITVLSTNKIGYMQALLEDVSAVIALDDDDHTAKMARLQSKKIINVKESAYSKKVE